MIKRLCKYLFVIFFIPNCLVQAQELSNQRIKKILFSDTITLDTLSIIPGSLILKDVSGENIDSTIYTFDFSHSRIIFKSLFSAKNSFLITASYRVFPVNLSKEFKHKDKNFLLKKESLNPNPFYSFSENKSSPIFEFGGLEKNGSISRGISFGNAQDVVVNSNMNLNLSGKLSDDIEITAAISDRNIPIQPEGNTQQIQDFDKVFIKLSTKKSKLIAGDLELTRPACYFMNFYKKAQGALLTTTQDILNKNGQIDKLTVTASAAISKGEYAKNTIIALEGIQGPYRLTGAENETYITVLSGTEKVFIDGRLLNRGQENDYVIDYNSATITFTPKQLITKDKRITVEFQYSDKNYARSLLFAGTEYQKKKLTLRFNYYSEQDMKNQPLLQTLDKKQKVMLAGIGNNINDAFYPAVDSISFNNDQILYKKIDSLGHDSVFVYSTNPDSAFYSLKFSYVGENKGNYIQIKSVANGKVFQWIAPKNKVLQGNYNPVILLITPKKKSMYAFSADYLLTKNTKVSSEFALSNNNLNTFSNKDKGDDLGSAFKVKIENKFITGKTEEKKWTITSRLNYEFVNKTFNPIERYKPVEFERDWNIKNLTTPTDEHLAGVNLNLSNTKIGTIAYQFQTLLKSSIYQGFNNILHFDLHKKNYFLKSDASVLFTNGQNIKTQFIRQQSSLSKKLKHIQIGLKDESEYNTFRNKTTNSLQPGSLAFNEWQCFVSSADTMKNQFKIYYKERRDQLPKDSSLSKVSTGQDFGFEMNLVKDNNNRLLLNSTYRRLTINDTSTISIKPENSLLGRIEYYAKWFKGIIHANTFYEIGSGMELKTEYSYIETTPGQGVYTWIDYNHNGIKELNEFEVAAFKDQANYIRVFTPTNQYVKTYMNQFNQLLDINPGVAWKNKTGIKKIVSYFSNKTVFSTNRKTNNDDLAHAYNPFWSPTTDTSIVSLNSSLRNTFYINRNGSRYSLEINYEDTRNKILLTNGYNARTLISQGIRFKWNINSSFMFLINLAEGKKTDSSDFLSTQNFKIKFYETEPQLTFQARNNLRITLHYKYTDKTNRIGNENIEKAVIQRIGTDIKYNMPSKASLTFRFDMIQIKYNSDENTSLAYEMLEALKSGQNLTWNVSFQREILNNLQLSFIYDGRQSPGTKTVNIGSVQVRAYF